MLRVPVYLFVARQHLIFDGRSLDIPALLGVIEQRRVAAPAEGISMLNGLLAVQQVA